MFGKSSNNRDRPSSNNNQNNKNRNKSNNNSMSTQPRPSNYYHAAKKQPLSSEMIFSDDEDSLIRDLDDIPSPRRNDKQQPIMSLADLSQMNSKNHQYQHQHAATSTPTSRRPPSYRSPILSADEELTLLAVKNKPNSPDHNQEGAPSPPRSSHRRLSFSNPKKKNKTSKRQRLPVAANRSLLDDDAEDQDAQQQHVYDAEDAAAATHHNTTHAPSRMPVVTTTYMDPTTGEAIHTTRPSTVQVPGLHAISSSSSSSSSSVSNNGPPNRHHCNDSATTTTPVTLGKQLHTKEGELKPYTTSYLPKGLDLLAPSASTTTEDSDSIVSREAMNSTNVAKNPYLHGVKLNGRPTAAGATASTDDDDDDDGESSSNPSLPSRSTDNDHDDDDDHKNIGASESTDSYVALHHLGQLMDDRENKEQELQARREAEEAEARIRAHTMTVPPRLDHRYMGGNSRSDYYYHDSRFPWKSYTFIGCLLLGTIVGVSVYFANLDTTNNGSSGPPNSNTNNNCQRALPLFNLTGGTVQGEILSNIKGNLGAVCQVEPGDGYTLWYSVQGTGQRLSASTCVGTDTSDDSDTQVLVFSGACGKLQCVGGSDQLCGSHGSVGWFAEQGKQYYIVVKGYAMSNQGFFTLTLNTFFESNGSCDVAMDISSLEGSPIFGSTRDLNPVDGDNSMDTCEEYQVDAPEAWFRILGDGSVMCASVSTEQSQKPDFAVTMSLLEGLSCSGLQCVGTTAPGDEKSWITGDIAFVAGEGTFYFMVVRGEQEDAQGDFILNLVNTPPNGVCEKAEPLTIGGGPTNGTMVNACNVEQSECQGILNQPGVWYSIEGNGELLIVHALGLTCHDSESFLHREDEKSSEDDGADFRSQVSVFKGDQDGCSDLECVDFTPLECTAGNQKVISSWFSDPGEIYYILVQSSDATEFEVMIDEFLPTSSNTCLNASTMVASGDASLGSTVGANSEDIGPCPNVSGEGVWYFVEGTGGSMEASTCNPGTNYSTALTIMTGGCDVLECVSSKTVTCDGERSMSYWDSNIGQQYFVYVHGQEPTDVGRFSLTIDEGSLGVENDFCGSAVPLTVPSTIYGSTVNATGDDDYAQMCGIAASGPGVWYTVVGDGRFITASLCGDWTSYDTQIYVFSGDSCKDMTCVAFNEDGCGNQSEATWQTQEGQLYFILVNGFSQSVGDFELVVS